MQNETSKNIKNDLLPLFDKLTVNYGDTINCEEQINKRKQIQQSAYPNQFFLEINLLKQEIVWNHNLKVFYDDSDTYFGFEEFLKLIPKECLNILNAFGVATHLVVKNNKHNLKFYETFLLMKYPMFSPILNKMVVVQQTGLPFGFDSDNNMISHLNQYTILLEEYKSNFEFITTFPNNPEMNAELYQLVKPQFYRFSEKQTKLLKLYAAKQKVNFEKAAAHLNCKKDNIKYLNKMIFYISLENGLGNFQTAKHVANYLKKLNWI